MGISGFRQKRPPTENSQSAFRINISGGSDERIAGYFLRHVIENFFELIGGERAGTIWKMQWKPACNIRAQPPA